MKNFLAILLTLISTSLLAQNCAVTSVGFPPLNDLETGTWRGEQGGLYPGGSNYRPVTHNNAGLAIAQQIVPLDLNGNPDPVNGKIVWLSVGMSNTTQESQVFIPMANSFPNKNPKLTLVDGAQGGQDITIIVYDTANFWSVINNRLANSGVSPQQVQVVWFKEAEKQPSDTAFATYPDGLKDKFKTAIQLVKDKFPNTKLCYLSSRIYAGYATSSLNPEPYAWYSGWTVKRLIEDQINGDTSLAFSGSNVRAPWLAWGPYLWADGTTPRSDGLIWVCPTDYNTDGTHPGTSGRQKVAQMLLDFFTMDSTTTPWFLDQTTGINEEEKIIFSITPNPATDNFTISCAEKKSLEIMNDQGQLIISRQNISGHYTFDSNTLPSGVYFIKLFDDTRSTIKPVAITH